DSESCAPVAKKLREDKEEKKEKKWRILHPLALLRKRQVRRLNSKLSLRKSRREDRVEKRVRERRSRYSTKALP
ncbi:hypothetical protein PFISCL1PPCAC_21801, partial [Pristionchus fissidentatus]